MRFFLIALLLLTSSATPLMAQEKQGKLGGFEDAAKGKTDTNKDSEENDTEDEDSEATDVGFVFEVLRFVFNIFWDSLTNTDEDDGYIAADSLEYVAPDSGLYAVRRVSEENVRPKGLVVEERATEANEPQTGFGVFPFDKRGMVTREPEMKNYMAQLALSGTRFTSTLSGVQLSGKFFLSGKNGINVDFQDFREDLQTRTDHLQIVQLGYRRLFDGGDRFYWAGQVGFIAYLPDKDKSSAFGPLVGLELRYLPVRPISLYGEITLSSLPTYGWASTLETKFGVGFHYKHLELYLGYHSFLPFRNPVAALNGPVIGLNIWF